MKKINRSINHLFNNDNNLFFLFHTVSFQSENKDLWSSMTFKFSLSVEQANIEAHNRINHWYALLLYIKSVNSLRLLKIELHSWISLSLLTSPNNKSLSLWSHIILPLKFILLFELFLFVFFGGGSLNKSVPEKYSSPSSESQEEEFCTLKFLSRSSWKVSGCVINLKLDDLNLLETICISFSVESSFSGFKQ